MFIIHKFVETWLEIDRLDIRIGWLQRKLSQGVERKVRKWSTLSENFMPTVHQNGGKWNIFIEKLWKFLS